MPFRRHVQSEEECYGNTNETDTSQISEALEIVQAETGTDEAKTQHGKCNHYNNDYSQVDVDHEQDNENDDDDDDDVTPFLGHTTPPVIKGRPDPTVLQWRLRMRFLSCILLAVTLLFFAFGYTNTQRAKQRNVSPGVLWVPVVVDLGVAVFSVYGVVASFLSLSIYSKIYCLTMTGAILLSLLSTVLSMVKQGTARIAFSTTWAFDFLKIGIVIVFYGYCVICGWKLYKILAKKEKHDPSFINRMGGTSFLNNKPKEYEPPMI